jgi:hypothetical protein
MVALMDLLQVLARNPERSPALFETFCNVSPDRLLNAFSGSTRAVDLLMPGDSVAAASISQDAAAAWRDSSGKI